MMESAPHETLARDALALLSHVAQTYAPAVLATAFQAEGMVLIDLIASAGLPIRVATIDTGRLPEETHALMHTVRKRYGISIDVYAPNTQSIESFVAAHGPNPFYASVGMRKACCAVRKTEPMARALAGKRAWISGLRRGQAATRSEVAVEEYDSVHGLHKFNPLAQWSEEEVWAYIRAHHVPYNALHDRGYPSIGCAPCTRAIEPGEDIRAGRWWWESSEHKECGIHRRPLAIPVVPLKDKAA